MNSAYRVNVSFSCLQPEVMSCVLSAAVLRWHGAQYSAHIVEVKLMLVLVFCYCIMLDNGTPGNPHCHHVGQLSKCICFSEKIL